MIEPLKKAPDTEKTVVGAKIETLYDCYNELPALASFFEHEGGGLLALSGGRLTVCGSIPSDELLSFADFVGALEIEGLEGETPELDGFCRTLHPIMEHDGTTDPTKCEEAVDLMAGYDILSSADNMFAESCDRWEWLSDMTRRRNCQRGTVYTRDGAAVVVTAKNSRELIIGAVASRPDARKKGAASALVMSVCRKAQENGLIPVTIAADEETAGFYSRIGFKKTDSLALLTRKQGL